MQKCVPLQAVFGTHFGTQIAPRAIGGVTFSVCACRGQRCKMAAASETAPKQYNQSDAAPAAKQDKSEAGV